MRWAEILVSIAALSAAAPVIAKEPRSIDMSDKSVNDLAGCIVLRLAETRGYEIAKAPLPNGIELRMKFRVAGVAATAATFLIEDLGAQRRLTIYATGKINGAPRVFAEGTRSCAN